jgi:catechol 2,3-dioxygenase-like lactoylglutathione lyase family enzyme
MTIKSVNVVSVPVSDQDRAKAFYTEKLGLTLVREDESVPGIRWVQVAPSHGATALTLVTWFDRMPPGCLQGLVLGSDDLDADYRSLTARGVRFDDPPRRQPWATEAVLHDPDGNMIVLQQT